MKTLTHSEICQLIQGHRKFIWANSCTIDELQDRIDQVYIDAANHDFDANLVCCSNESFLKFIKSKDNAKG